jgi:hypothetical protein
MTVKAICQRVCHTTAKDGAFRVICGSHLVLARLMNLYPRLHPHPHSAHSILRAALRLTENMCTRVMFWPGLLRIVETSCPIYHFLLFVIAA